MKLVHFTQSPKGRFFDIVKIMKDLKTVIAEYLSTTKVMQIATCVDDTPWCCTVYFAYDDDDWNLYWISKPEQRHSREISKNPRVAGAIAYDQQPPQRVVRGLQFEGTAELLMGREEEKASKYYIKQLDREASLLEDIRSGTNPHKFYRIKPSKFVLFDRLNFPNKERQEYVV